MDIKDIYLIYKPHYIIVYDRVTAPALPVSQKSIDKVITVLRSKIVVTSKNIESILGLAKSTVLRVLHHLDEIGAITINITRAKGVQIKTVTYIRYDKPIKIIQEENALRLKKIEKYKAKKEVTKRKITLQRKKEHALAEYKHGGLTMAYVARKYKLALCILQSLVNYDRGSNKKKPRKVNRKIITLAPINGASVVLDVIWRRDTKAKNVYINSPPKPKTLNAVIATIINKKGIEKNTIISTTGLSFTVVQKALKFLIKYHIIRKTRQGKRRGRDFYYYTVINKKSKQKGKKNE